MLARGICKGPNVRFSLFALIAVTVLTSALARLSWADRAPLHSASWREIPRHLAQLQADIGPDAAAAKVRDATGGRVLGVRSDGRGGYRVKVLLPGGRVRVVSVDGHTGRMGR